MNRSPRLFLLITLLAATAAPGCSAGRFSQNAHCALIGGGLGTATGLGIAILDDAGTGEVVASGAVGLAVGALAGYGFCVLVDPD